MRGSIGISIALGGYRIALHTPGLATQTSRVFADFNAVSAYFDLLPVSLDFANQGFRVRAYGHSAGLLGGYLRLTQKRPPGRYRAAMT